MKRKIKKLMSYLIWKVIYKLMYIFPIQNDKIFYDSFMGKGYTDNPKAIYEYIVKHDNSYKHVWSLKKTNTCIPGNPVIVKRITLKYLYHLTTSGIQVNNSRMPNLYKKREGQIFIQTWHGTPLKKLALDMDHVLLSGTNKKKYRESFVKDSSQWNYLIAPNEYSMNIFKRAFDFKGEFIKTGYPRNDQLVNYKDYEVDDLKLKLGLPLDKKIILYTPTFRDQNSKGLGMYTQDFGLDLEKLSKQDDVVVLLRVHYLVVDRFVNKFNNIIDFSDYDNINDLMIVSDVLLTDYSSTMFDYLLLRKPIVLNGFDVEIYRDKVRGFYLEYTDLPADNITDVDSLLLILEDLSAYKEKHKESYDRALQTYSSFERGQSSKNVFDLIKKL